MSNTETATMADVEQLFTDLEATIGRLPFAGNDQRGRAVQTLELARNEIRSAGLSTLPPSDEPVALEAAQPSLDESGSGQATAVAPTSAAA